MIYQLLKKAIEQKNTFMTPDMIALQIQFFLATGKITAEEADELMGMLYPPEPVVEEPIAE